MKKVLLVLGCLSSLVFAGKDEEEKSYLYTSKEGVEVLVAPGFVTYTEVMCPKFKTSMGESCPLDGFMSQVKTNESSWYHAKFEVSLWGFRWNLFKATSDRIELKMPFHRESIILTRKSEGKLKYKQVAQKFETFESSAKGKEFQKSSSLISQKLELFDFGEKVEEAKVECHLDLKYNIDFKSIPQEVQDKVSVGSYCGYLAQGLAHLCQQKDESLLGKIKTIKVLNCSYGSNEKISLDKDSLNIIFNDKKSNVDDFVSQGLKKL